MAAAAPPAFIEQFELAVNNLAAITEANVKDSIARRTQFTTNVLAGLTDINTEVQTIIRRLTRFSQRYQQLISNQGRYDFQIKTLTQRVEEMEKQINELAAKNGSSLAAAQQEIAQCREQQAQLQAQIEALQKNNAQLTQELESLREQIVKLIGQQPAQDQDLMQQLEQQIQKLNDQIIANNKTIADLQGLNQQLEQKLKISQGASYAAQEANQKIIDGHQGNIDNLERQIAELTAARDDLQARIERATPILQQVYGYINNLLNAPPLAGQETQFNETLDEIKKSLQQLNDLIPDQFNDNRGPPGSPGSSGASELGAALGFGSSSASGSVGLGSLSGEPSSPSSASDLPDFGSDSNSVVSEQSAGHEYGRPSQETFNNSPSTMLGRMKPKNIPRNNPGQGILSNSSQGGIYGNIVGDDHLGGKNSIKTKKNRKQKGGYTYRDNKAGYIVVNKTKKNRNRTTKTSRRKSSRSSRRTTSKNSLNY